MPENLALRRGIAPVLLIVLAASLLTVARSSSSPPARPPSGPVVREAADAPTAVRLAAAQRSAVRIAKLTTANRVVDAQPDGTMTATLSAGPVRARKGGKWLDVDTTLVRRADGVIVPRVALAEYEFSGGGKGTPLVRYGRGSERLALSWPGRLPAAVVDGSTATYPEVLPGVDLMLRAEADGYAHHLVVKNAKAAKNPALHRIKLGLTTKGVRVSASRSGVLEAKDAKGRALFRTPPAQMWDAAAKPRRAAVGVAVAPGSLTLTPDRALLTGPKTEYPVVVDPDWRTYWNVGWTKVFSGAAGSTHWGGSNDVDGWAKVGYCGWAGCNGIGTARSYFMFDTGFLSGKQIISAGLNATIVYGPSCNTRNHQLFMANAGIGGGTSWNNAPQGWHVGTAQAASNYSGCGGNKGIGFNVLGNVNTAGISTYFLKAENEGDAYAWRKYDAYATHVVVNYNTRPNAPYDLGTDPPLSACRWCDGTPYVGNAGIRLQTRLSDPDNDQVRPIWDIYGGGSSEHRDWGPWQGSGAFFSTDLDLRERHGQHVTWTAWASDGHDGGPWASGPGFIVDRVGVDKPPTVAAPLYQDDNRWHGGVDVPDTFTFTADGVPDIDHYRYGWQDPPSTKVDASALGGPASVTLTPPGDGPRTLYVQSVDRAGNASPTKAYRIYVRAGSGPLAQWSLDGNTRDTAFLGDRDGTLAGGTSYQAGAAGMGLRVAAATGGQMTAAATVRTDTSFSVTAWVKLDKVDDKWQGVVRQEGANQCAFCLHYEGSRKRFVFVMPQADSTGAQEYDFVVAPAEPVAGQWTHLAGVYDAAAKKVRLYVDGVPAGSATRDRSWHGAGSLAVGKGLTGMVDEVRMYDRVLSDTEVRAAVSQENVQVGHWKLDDQEGTTAANAAPGGESAVLQPGAVFVREGLINGAARFDGTKGFATTSGPAVRTDRSFSVAAWVRADRLAGEGAATTFVSQDGWSNSGFLLQQRGTSWQFSMPNEELAKAPWPGWAASPAGTAQQDVPTHVAGVYDAAAKKIRVYVNGALAGESDVAGAWNATGPLVIGRGMISGAQVDRWPGLIDEVRVYSRALAGDEIEGIVGRDGVPAATWRFDGTAQDASARALHGTLQGGPAWAAGQSTYPDAGDLAVQLDGADDHVSAPGVLDTSQSFSVAAWARLDKTGKWSTVVSQDGSHASAFFLQVMEDGHWCFFGSTADEPQAPGDRAKSSGLAQLGVWTHLVGVYRKQSKQLEIYVNGVLAGTAAHQANIKAGGGLQIGRARYNDSSVDFFPGAVDDVTVYSRPLFADEIKVMAGRDLSLAHNWRLDESSGSNVSDAAGARAAKLAGGATFAPGRVGNGIELDGVNDAAVATGVDVRTDQNFTVSSWVYLPDRNCDLTTVERCRMDAVALEGSDDVSFSKFRLGHLVDDLQRPDGAWVFEMPEQATGRVTKAAVTTEPTDVNTWVHLTGVYNADTRKLWLYVNGSRIGDGTLNAPWNGAGPLQIGRGKAGGAHTAYWKGRVDDVRVYAGALDDGRVKGLHGSYPARIGPDKLPAADAGHWKLDEGSGTTAADSSSRGLPATLKGGTGWIGGRTGAGAWLDGTTGYAETAGPALDTGRSFSVTAWAYLTQTGNGNRAVVAQDGAHVSSFMLHYNAGANKWAVWVPETDTGTPGGTLLTSAQAASPHGWTHLAAVYDAGLRQLRLYVNGVLSAAQVGVTVWKSTGPLTIGRSKWDTKLVDFFPRGIDDVRAYSRALSDGEVRKVHDDAASVGLALWRFDDGTGRNSEWTDNHLTLSGGATLGSGVTGKSVRLDGVGGAATAGHAAVNTRDSFTVSAWAKLSRTDQVATVLAQEGMRTSAIVLQYRPDLKRWVFGARAQDADGAELVYAAAPLPAKAGEWTHLAGVYDYAARQLRLYVDGELAGTRDGVALWISDGVFTVGRGRVDGAPAEFFPGEIDEVHTDLGMVTEKMIGQRATWGKPVGHQLGSYVNGAGDHYTSHTSEEPPAGYHFESTLGTLVPSEQPHTRVLYACLFGADAFTSVDPQCEGQTVVGEIGRVYTRQPTNVPTVAVYRCNNGPDHFESSQPGCGGAKQEGVLGYTLGYASLARYYGPAWDHVTTFDGSTAVPPGHWAEGPSGWVALTARPGTQPLTSCVDGDDQFVSLDATCGGKTVQSALGHIWTEQPDGVASRALYACRINGEGYTSLRDDCEGYQVERRLGYVLIGFPNEEPVFE
ncbi:LamG domain-containing protein [Actinoplanes sp. ATCC 53533]|uniref:LamG domain-containing protein n=1 Tax=Actinoplanes sp. ATCC 53533 TaxID=1288362 RepID=UPI000F78439A|nr:LamG domain-containing protein [Actinoplanes sp. ATCC 53533]